MSMSRLSDSDLKDWMSKLSANLWDTPLYELAIPGSHISFSFSIDASSEIGPDANDSVKALAVIGKGVIYKWSVTQCLNFREQLAAGVRYFDLRVASRKRQDKIHFLHTLYGMTVEQGLIEIMDFLKEHEKEVVILDFNHLFNMTDEQHKDFINDLVDICGEKLCLFVGMESLNLNMMWENNLQVIILYHHEVAKDFCQIWPGNMCIRAPWAKTSNLKKMISFLDSTHSSDRGEHFHVAQGILTPDGGFIFSNLTGSLKNNAAKPAMPEFIEWIKTKEKGKTGLNIVMADFIELNDFTKTVIMLNEK